MTTTRILVVDDEDRGVELLVRTLRGIGVVETAASADAGWAMFRDGGFDLIVSDQRMPGMSGIELLSRVAQRSPTTGRILLTGYTDLEATLDAINRGHVHAYLTKPCAPPDVQAVVREVMERIERLSPASSPEGEKLAKQVAIVVELAKRIRAQADGEGEVAVLADELLAEAESLLS